MYTYNGLLPRILITTVKGKKDLGGKGIFVPENLIKQNTVLGTKIVDLYHTYYVTRKQHTPRLILLTITNKFPPDNGNISAGWWISNVDLFANGDSDWDILEGDLTTAERPIGGLLNWLKK